MRRSVIFYPLPFMTGRGNFGAFAIKMDAGDYGDSGCFIARNVLRSLSERYILPARVKVGKARTYDRKAGVAEGKC